MNTNPGLNLKEWKSYGKKSTQGNLVAIEPYVVPEDYATVESFQAKLDGYLAFTQAKGWLNERTVVVWPEFVGTWLVFTGETPSPTLPGIVTHLADQNLAAFSVYFGTSKEENKLYAALFRTKAQAMADAYLTVFSNLAKKYQVTTVAGTLVLPSPQIVDGKLVLDVNGPLYNVCMVLDAHGNPYPDLVFKAYPTAGELPYTTPAPVGMLPAFDTPIGRMGVLICADSFFPQAYARLKNLNVDFIAVPSYGDGGLKAWKAKWGGYSGWPNPSDVDLKDVGRITNSKAWKKYSLIGRIQESGAAHGINVFLHGNLWAGLNMGGGVTAVVYHHKNKEEWNREHETPQATINNLWF